LSIPLIFRSGRLFSLPALALFAALLLLTWLLAHWTWVFLSPRQHGQAAGDVVTMSSKVLAEKVVGLRLFGAGVSTGEIVSAAPIAAPSNIGVRGVYSGRDGRTGFAVLVVDGNPIAALVGQEFAPGMILQRVYPENVEIVRNGQLESVRMASAQMGSPSATPTVTSGLLMNVRQLGSSQYGISRGEMLKVLKRPDQFPLLGRFGPHPRGGALLEQSPAGGLADKLGLKVGDVITALNGKSLSGPGDVARLYDQLVKSERVSVDVMRAGSRMNFGIQVAP